MKPRVLLGVALVLGGCAPNVSVTMLDGAPEPRQSTGEVAVYSTRTPECPYTEFAVVIAYEGELFSTLDAALLALKQRAAELGADALVGLEVVHSGGENSRPGYSATAVQFTDSTCIH